ncbi:hypothetical protein ABT160_16620 [Streptomyces sp. NPDC001941]|uniref:hypothetical protein n=1 Tax=Streptomyces sp. NPDC001941 TaxID=3154659 RepID=UPI00332B4EC8
MTAQADFLAALLRELTAGMSARELAGRYGSSRGAWEEYRSGARVAPLGRLRAVIEDRVPDPHDRSLTLARAAELYEAALEAERELRAAARRRACPSGADAEAAARTARLRAERELAETDRLAEILLALITRLESRNPPGTGAGAPTGTGGEAHRLAAAHDRLHALRTVKQHARQLIMDAREFAGVGQGTLDPDGRPLLLSSTAREIPWASLAAQLHERVAALRVDVTHLVRPARQPEPCSPYAQAHGATAFGSAAPAGNADFDTAIFDAAISGAPATDWSAPHVQRHRHDHTYTDTDTYIAVDEAHPEPAHTTAPTDATPHPAPTPTPTPLHRNVHTRRFALAAAAATALLAANAASRQLPEEHLESDHPTWAAPLAPDLPVDGATEGGGAAEAAAPSPTPLAKAPAPGVGAAQPQTGVRGVPGTAVVSPQPRGPSMAGDVAKNPAVYAVSADGARLMQWSGAGTDWTPIGPEAAAVYAGGAGLFVTKPDDDRIFKYEGTAHFWTSIGAPGHQYAIAGDGLYAISADGNEVLRWGGRGDSWERIGGAASGIRAGGAGLFVRSGDDGRILKYLGEPGRWETIGPPVADLAVGDQYAYALDADRTGIWQWTGRGEEWIRIGAGAERIHAGGAGLFAVGDGGQIFKYDGTPGSWTAIGPAGAELIVDGRAVYRISTDHRTVTRWTGRGTEWTKIGAGASTLASAE